MDNTYTEPVSQDKTLARGRPPDPYIDQTPIHVLQRERRIAGFSQTGNIALPTWALYDPMRLLIDDSTNSSYLVPFGGIAADLRIRIQLTGNSATYGLIQVSWYYGAETASTEVPNEFLNRISSANTFLLDASSSESLEFVVPFLYPRTYFPSKSLDGYMTLLIANRGTYTATGGTDFPSVDIFANFEKVSTHILTTETIVNENAENRIIPAQRAMSVGGALLLGKMSWDAFTTSMREFNTMSNNVQQMVSEARTAATNAVEATQEVGNFVHETVTTVTDFFSQSSSTSGGHSPVKQSFYGDISTTSYEFDNNLLDITHPTKLVNILPQESVSLESLSNIPSLIGQFTWLSTTPIGTSRTTGVALCPDVAGLLTSETTWACYISKNFRLVSYDTVLMFHFRLTPLTSARVRIVINYATNTDTGNYDLPSEIILIKGSVDVPIYVPYVNINPLVEPTTEIARVYVELIEPPKEVAGTAVTMPMWVSKSFRNVKFCSPQSFVVEQAEMRNLHRMVAPKPFMQTSNVLSHLTEVKSLDTLLRRYDDDLSFVTDPIIAYPPSKIEFVNLPNYQKLTLPFAYYTGSKEVKIRSNEPVDPVAPSVNLGFTLQNTDINQVRISDGQTITDARIWPLIECVIPYISNLPFQATKTAPNYSVSSKVFGATPIGFNPLNTSIISRGGPDYGVGFANVLPDTTLWL